MCALASYDRLVESGFIGRLKRDFTYIDDIVEGITRLIPTVPTGNSAWRGEQPDPATSFAPYKIYNIGNNQPVELMHFIEVLEQKLNKKAIKNLLPIQDGDVPATFADVDDLMRDVGFKPGTSIEDGIGKFVDWYLEFYNVKK